MGRLTCVYLGLYHLQTSQGTVVAKAGAGARQVDPFTPGSGGSLKSSSTLGVTAVKWLLPSDSSSQVHVI